MQASPLHLCYEIDLRHKPEDVEELDLKGRAHRRHEDQTPDPYSLAQKFRGVGSFLDYRPETTLTTRTGG